MSFSSYIKEKDSNLTIDQLNRIIDNEKYIADHKITEIFNVNYQALDNHNNNRSYLVK